MSRGLIIAAVLLLLSGSNASAQALSSMAPSSTAQAQEPGEQRPRFMIGFDYTVTATPGPESSNRGGLGFAWRYRSATPRLDDRWAFSYRFSSYGTDLTSTALGNRVSLGEMRLRPLLVGAEYKMPRGKWQYAVGATAGWSINRLNTSDAFRNRLTAMTGADVMSDIHNSFAWSPRFRAWYDLNRKMSFMVESTYNYSRPEVTIRSGATDLSHRLNADALIVKAGFLYGIH